MQHAATISQRERWRGLTSDINSLCFYPVLECVLHLTSSALQFLLSLVCFFSTLQLPLQANLCLYSFFSFAFVIFSAAAAMKTTQWPPVCNICLVMFKSFILSQTRAEHLSAWQLRGFCCLMREKPLCVFQLEVEGEDDHSAVWQQLSVLSLACVFDNKTIIAGMLGPICWRWFHNGCTVELCSNFNPTGGYGCFISTYSNDWFTDSLHWHRWRHQLHAHKGFSTVFHSNAMMFK